MTFAVSQGESFQDADLSDREIRVLSVLVLGATNIEIGTELGIGAQTVRNYMASIFEKCGLHTRVAVLLWGQRHATEIESRLGNMKRSGRELKNGTQGI